MRLYLQKQLIGQANNKRIYFESYCAVEQNARLADLTWKVKDLLYVPPR